MMNVMQKPLPNIEQKPRIAGIAGTIAFWTLFLLLSTVFSWFVRKPVYKTVQIHLDSPQKQTQEARAAAAWLFALFPLFPKMEK